MSREIKFRAWHKAEKKMCKVKILTDNGAFLIGVKKGKDTVDDRTHYPAPTNGRFCKNKEIVLMEFTGLEDKKGKMILEGDICKVIYYNHSSPDAVFIQEVCFEKGTFTLKCEETELDEFRTNVPIYHCLPPNKIEVIGNIFEDPNILKGKLK